ncbi:MAG: hypothetical protein HYS32_01385 [Candidatus Woesearchaeota archaeon]|nr:MAG: hypothetical protein HYS32_01385 [Candidatus Woesearchaeota archaeon]
MKSKIYFIVAVFMCFIIASAIVVEAKINSIALKNNVQAKNSQALPNFVLDSKYSNLEICDDKDNNGDGVIDAETDINPACEPKYIAHRFKAYNQLVDEVTLSSSSLNEAHLLVNPRKFLLNLEFASFLVSNGYVQNSNQLTKFPLEDVLFITNGDKGYLMVTFSDELLGILNPGLDKRYRANVQIKNGNQLVSLFGLTRVIGEFCADSGGLGGLGDSVSVNLRDSSDVSFGYGQRDEIYQEWINSILNGQTQIFSLTSYAKTVLENGEIDLYLDSQKILSLETIADQKVIRRVGSFYDNDKAYIVLNLGDVFVSDLGKDWKGQGFNFWVLETTNKITNEALEVSGGGGKVEPASDLFCSI